MRKRILAMILSVTMMFGVCTMANAATQVDAGTVTLPEQSWVIDGGFETARYINEELPEYKKTYIPTFTAPNEYGESTERYARNAQIMAEEGFAAEGNQCILLEPTENLTIKIPNLAQYKGATLVFKYYVRAKRGTIGYGIWGRIDDRSIMEDVPVLDLNGDQKVDPITNERVFEKKAKVVYNFTQKISYWENPENLDHMGKWILLTEELVIPNTVSETSQYVFEFGCYGEEMYFDGISCVVKKADGTFVDPSVFSDTTPMPTPEPTPTPTILVNPEISSEVVAPGTKVSLPENSLVTDGGFEKVRYDNPEDPLITYVDAFTATDDYGLSNERSAESAKIMDEEGFAVEGEKCILLEQGENITIALPDLYKYKGGKLVLYYYVRAKMGQNYGTWGRLEDRSIEDKYKDAYGVHTKFRKISSFANGISYWENPNDIDYVNNWTKVTEEMLIPDFIDEDNQYVLNFGSYGNELYFDAISCVLYDKDGKEIRYVDGVLVDPTPEPSPTPVVTQTPTPAVTPTATPVVSVTPSVTATPTSTVEPTKPPVKKSVRFTKKKVTIKRGKKATLKVKITGAKKAKFSVNKKGKKVVKLMKKKAKKVTVKGKKKGKAVITAKAAGKKSTCKVTVK